MPDATPTVGDPDRKITALQNLRGVAVLLTVMAHLPLFTEPFYKIDRPAPYWVGVCIFYGISGFIISLTTEKKGWDFLSAFYIRRLMRIFPVLLLTLLWALILSCALPHVPMVDQFYGRADQMLRICAAQIALLGNFTPFMAVATPLCLAGLWTISVEAQFYMVYGLVLCVTPRIRSGLLMLAALGLFLGKIAIYTSIPSMLFEHLFYYEILLVSAALCPFRNRILISRYLYCGCMIYVILFPQIPKTLVIYVLAYPALAAAIGYISVCTGRNMRFLNHDSFVGQGLSWLGERSFVIYVMHFQVLSIAGLAMQSLGLNFTMPVAYDVGLALCVVLAAPLYEFVHFTVERAGIVMGRRWSGLLAS